MLTDEQFIQEFEQTCLDPKHFNHIGHVRLAWIYLSHYSKVDATQKITQGISRYATSLGAPDKFHMTMTCALIKIISQRRGRDLSLSWDDFCANNEDLINHASRILNQHYSEELLQSEAARSEFLLPDIRPLKD
jgi:hypothetical protein